MNNRGEGKIGEDRRGERKIGDDVEEKRAMKMKSKR